MTHEIILVQSLHNKDDAPVLFVIQAAEKGMVVPVIDVLPLRSRECTDGG